MNKNKLPWLLPVRSVLFLLIFGLVWSGFILLIMFALINALIYRKTGVDLLIKLQNLRKHKEVKK